MSRFARCNCPAGVSAPGERHAPDCPSYSGITAPMAAMMAGGLSTQPHAGVDGLEVVGTLRYFMDYPDSPHSAPGYITHQFNPASWDHAGEAAGEHKLCRLSDAQAIIDGLRGEVAQLQSMLATVSKAGIRVRTDRDQQAQRIGELEGLLREWRRMFDGGLESGQLGVLRGHTDAALSAGKEGE